MKKYIIPTILGFLTITSVVYGATVLFPYQGGTGTGTAPSYGQLLMGNAGGTYTLTATSSLGITASETDPVWTAVSGNYLLTSNAFTQALASTTFVDRAAWTSINNYPTGCTNQFIRTIGDTLTCATVANTDLANSTIGLTSSGSITVGTSPISLGGTSALNLNMANANSWTALQTFVNASTTLISADKIFVNGVGTSTFAGNVKVTGNLEVTGVSLLTLVTSGNLGVNGTLVVTGQTTLATSLTGLLKGSSGVVSTASAGSDYENPLTFSFPLKRATNAITFVGLSTSTSPTVSNLSYWTGVNTFGTVATSSLAVGASITSSGTLGSQVGGTGTTLSLNMANANSWTALQTFANSTTTLGNFATSLWIPNSATQSPTQAGMIALDTTSSQIKYGDGATKVLGNGNQYATITYATSTAWSATTTISLGTARVAETWNDIQCFTDTGTVGVSFGDGTNQMRFISASTTVGTTVVASNNTFTAGEKRYVYFGTPATSPTQVSCTISKSITAD